MAFTFTKSDGSPITVSLAQDNTYSLVLSGTGSLTYPQDLAQNFIRHLENFASDNPPLGTPLLGQLWFDTAENKLKIYDGVVWILTGGGIITNTDNVPEGPTNLYYTTSRARAAISVAGDLSYNPSNGVISYTTPAVAGYTDADARTAISVSGNLAYDSNTGVISYTYTNANVRAAITTTGDINYDQANGIISYSLPNIDPFSQSIVVACSDETTALTSGLATTLRVPIQMTLTNVRASLTNAQTSGNLVTIDIRQNNTSILSTLITIDNNEKTSLTANTLPVISNVSLVNDAELTIYVTNVDAATTAAGLKVSMVGYNGSAGFIVGYTGSSGYTGSQGVIGGTGYTGSGGLGYSGSVGFTGSFGPQGDIGFTGSGGLGYTGSAGSGSATPGFTGSQGNIGFTGSGGLGYTGSAGASGTAGAFSVVTGTTQSAVNNGQYALINTAATTVTLPSGPAVGDLVTITVANGRLDNVVARNGANIMAYPSDLTLNIANSTISVRYINSTLGWWIV